MKVAELFAGVGGFRLGLDRSNHKTVWANQWEPKTKVQHAYDCYVSHFGDFKDLNTDIYEVDKSSIPDHDLLVGGFPCQDYSVATTRARGIEGKKGVLWWSIYDTIISKKPNYILLENVDRLLKSPVPQRGRDFAIILSCLLKEGYAVEWRVINAADYGFAQKRRRVFIFGAKRRTDWYSFIAKNTSKNEFIETKGFFSKEFPVKLNNELEIEDSVPNCIITEDVQAMSDSFAYGFMNSGVMFDGNIWTKPVKPIDITPELLGDILIPDVDESYYIHTDEIGKWEYLKGAKKEPRVRKDGSEFVYSEGGIPFPDNLDSPSRTIITSEGGLTPSRFKHLVEDPWTNRLRVLTPEEVEKLNGFPPGWTKDLPINWRYFCMGNALVVGLVEKMGKTLFKSPIK